MNGFLLASLLALDPSLALATTGTPSPATSAPAETSLEALIKERLAIPKPDLTQLQIEEAYRAFEQSLWGRRVKIEGTVLDAVQRSGGYFIQVQLPHMARPMLLPAHREAAVAARRGAKITVTGTLRGLHGIHLEPDLDDLRFPELPPPGGKPSTAPSPSPKVK
ncbi:MAG: hypothetical protein VKP62_16995 [Candidatus Sericytochromatia bacterium]|nr:hypothetical protein [Candidatus Sericytochromatia bacterium]